MDSDTLIYIGAAAVAITAIFIAIVIIFSNSGRKEKEGRIVPPFSGSEVNIVVGEKVLSDKLLNMTQTITRVQTLLQDKVKIKKEQTSLKMNTGRTPEECKKLSSLINDYIIERNNIKMELLTKHLYIKTLIAQLWTRLKPDAYTFETRKLDPAALPLLMAPDGSLQNAQMLEITVEDVNTWFGHYKSKFCGVSNLRLDVIPMEKKSNATFYATVTQPNLTTIDIPGYVDWDLGDDTSTYDSPKESGKTPAAAGASADNADGEIDEETRKANEKGGTAMKDNMGEVEQKIRQLCIEKNNVRKLYHEISYNPQRTQEDCNSVRDAVNAYKEQRKQVRMAIAREHIFLTALIRYEWMKAAIPPAKSENKRREIPPLASPPLNLDQILWGKDGEIKNRLPLCINRRDLGKWFDAVTVNFKGVSLLHLPVPKKMAFGDRTSTANRAQTPNVKFSGVEVQIYSKLDPSGNDDNDADQKPFTLHYTRRFDGPTGPTDLLSLSRSDTERDRRSYESNKRNDETDDEFDDEDDGSYNSDDGSMDESDISAAEVTSRNPRKGTR